ncbi:MAG: helix-turn-helix transcriptional regulator [Clostridia bacterium]|nr:helix-turn-helix transcriptional regulator [Clostridia bacterium]
MEILFKQAEGRDELSSVALNACGIRRCYCKWVCVARDRMHITRKRHHHTGFEVHLIEKGAQVYEIGGATVEVRAGEFLLISPNVRHTVLHADPQTEKYSFFFSLADAGTEHLSPSQEPFVTGRTPAQIEENLRFLSAQRRSGAAYVQCVVGNRVLECLLLLFRQLSWAKASHAEHTSDEDLRLSLAKQYIADNVCRPIGVEDVASYCCIGTKQMTRIFHRCEGITVAEYVRRARCEAIERLLLETDLPLRQISEQMHFNNEYYFNAFFKQHAGVSPGAYRKMMRRG